MKSPRVWMLGIAVGAAILCTTPRTVVSAQAGETGTIAGHVQVIARSARRLATAGVYPGRVVGVQRERDTSELDNVIVFVNTHTRVDSLPTQATIRQTNEEFVPHVVAVTAGSTVEFPNDDLVFHNVFSLSHAATFDLGRYPRNASKSRTFTTPGIVKVFCHLHSHMNALVRVFSHPYFVTPGRDGRFTLSGVPAGRHEVSAWHERVGEVTHLATLDGGGTTELAFSLPLPDEP